MSVPITLSIDGKAEKIHSLVFFLNEIKNSDKFTFNHNSQVMLKCHMYRVSFSAMSSKTVNVCIINVGVILKSCQKYYQDIKVV